MRLLMLIMRIGVIYFFVIEKTWFTTHLRAERSQKINNMVENKERLTDKEIERYFELIVVRSVFVEEKKEMV